ncbi:hydantoinase/oxoprolinase N-terminal domain-containing protein [Sphingobium sp. LB126]|uniref:hydantoinase/oxoprolinase N-terminal domain-containing protein n=1 Tax=Sphingobium sp. LB126 TaxID=1983755 RepID=UPI0012FE0B63|nr:hydantoinase/oxoprolinase N-terminal domain-containing protein [Sphingobium sp. LB126]
MDSFPAGVEIGGTFTDRIVVSDDGEVVTAQARSSLPNYTEGLIESLSRTGLP